MKIAIFTDIYAPWGNGGIATSIKAQKAELIAQGHEVILFCPGFKAKEPGVVTVPSHKYLRISGSVIAKRPSVVEDFVLSEYPNFAEFDVVHVHYEASCSIAGVRLAQRFGVPLVQTMHGREDMAITNNIPHPFKFLVASALNFAHGRCLKHTLKVRRDQYQAPTYTRARMWSLIVNHAEQADLVITPSCHFAQKIEHYGVTKPIEVVSNAVPDELVAQDFPVRELEDGEVLKMIWNCRVSHEKRIMPFLQALNDLKRPYILHVYGNGNQLKTAQRYAEANRLKVKFYGAQPREKIIKRMSECHLGVTVSYNFDVQPLTLLEAEATGLPVFLCDPTLRETVPVGSYVLADGPEATAMANALDNLDAADIAKMSKKMLTSRSKILQTKQIARLIDVYRLALKMHNQD